MSHNLKKGDILPSVFTYGDEIKSYKFFEVMSTTDCTVTLRKLEQITEYDNIDGPYYYNSPRHTKPLLGKYEGRPFKRKVRNFGEGLFMVSTEEFYRAYSVWNGKPMEVYNLH